MRNSQKKPQNYAIDGFVPRSRAGQPRRRSTIDGMSSSRPQASELTKPATQTGSHSAQEPFAFEDDMDVTGSLARPIDVDLSNEELVRPKWWQFKKKKAYKQQVKQLKQERSHRRKKVVKRVALLVVLLGLLIGGFLGWKVLRNTAKVFNGNVLGFFDTTKLKGEEDGRVNILLAGTSEDDGPDHGGATLTDSIMIVSVDTKNNTGFTVSIPRDLWVSYGEQCAAGYEGKINNAYECGEATNFKETGYAEGGMGLLEKILSKDLGIPIHYYGKINYTAFRDAVDAVGGIEITVDSTDPRGIYDPNIQPKDGGPLRLKNGLQKLDGKTALALARSRNSHGGYGMSRGDFDRTTYQRAMLLALKDKALSSGVITNPAKIGDLLDTAGNNVKTDLKTSELRRLYDLSKLVKNQDVSSVDLAGEEVGLLNTGAYNGQSIVKPVAGIKDFSQLKLFFSRLTSTDPAVKEAPQAVVLNGSGVSGLAQKKADALAAKGITVATVANASKAYDKTVIVDLTAGKKPASKRSLEAQFGATATTNKTLYPEVTNYKTDFVIILGKDAAVSPAN